jgi:HAD superfamily hydrolase (TIGR01509 family)
MRATSGIGTFLNNAAPSVAFDGNRHHRNAALRTRVSADLAIKAVFFDYDGVLWDSEVVALRSWQETYGQYGQSLPLHSFVTRLGTVGGMDLVAELERLVGTSLDREAVERRRWERKMELVRELKPRPGILDYIAEARRRGLAVAVVSTDDTQWIMTGLTVLGLSDAFDFIECAEGDKTRAKPSPALYLSALDRLALTAEEAIAIEDSPNGIHAAKSAGLFCVGYANAVTRQLDLSEADLVVDSLDDLPLSDALQTATADR